MLLLVLWQKKTRLIAEDLLKPYRWGIESLETKNQNRSRVSITDIHTKQQQCHQEAKWFKQQHLNVTCALPGNVGPGSSQTTRWKVTDGEFRFSWTQHSGVVDSQSMAITNFVTVNLDSLIISRRYKTGILNSICSEGQMRTTLTQQSQYLNVTSFSFYT